MDPEGNMASSDPKQPSSSASLGSPLTEPVQEVIPEFYTQDGGPAPNEKIQQCLLEVDSHFHGLTGLRINEFKAITRDVCKLPSFFSTTLFRKIDVNNIGIVTRDRFVEYWIGGNMLTMKLATLIFTVLKQPGSVYLTQDDFRPLLQELLASHPGLEFVRAIPDFPERYEDTVVYTIFYYINRSGTGHITLRELKRGNLISAMLHVDQEEDINRVRKYFSYEHFYVIYLTFCHLDPDEDFSLDIEDIKGYRGYCLTDRIIDRIFAQVPRNFVSNIEGRMCYEDFVYFMLSEEDKLSEPAMEYWFKCIDLDGNGVLTPNELRHFYEEQQLRMELLRRDVIPFDDILTQILDMIGPEDSLFISLRDIKRCKLSGEVFNILFNLKKFIAFEEFADDPIRIRQVHENPSLTEWERFAHEEYVRIITEEADDDWAGSDGTWGPPLDED